MTASRHNNFINSAIKIKTIRYYERFLSSLSRIDRIIFYRFSKLLHQNEMKVTFLLWRKLISTFLITWSWRQGDQIGRNIAYLPFVYLKAHFQNILHRISSNFCATFFLGKINALILTKNLEWATATFHKLIWSLFLETMCH
jgi:hypothetical protein